MEEEREVEEFEESEEKFEETKKVKMVEISYDWGKDGNGLTIIVRDDDLSALELANLALRIYSPKALPFRAGRLSDNVLSYRIKIEKLI